MINIAQTVLEKTEALLLRQYTEYKIWTKFTRHCILPFKYIFMGVQDLFKPFQFFIVTLWGLLIISVFLLNFSGLLDIAKPFLIYVYLVVPLILILFAVPTTFSFGGVNSKDVLQVTEFIDQEDIENSTEVELLEQNFSFLFERIKNRIKLYQWVIGACWAFYMLFFNLGIRMLLANDNKEALGEHFVSFVQAFFITFAAIILVKTYKMANERLIKTIEFACVQQKYNLGYYEEQS